MVQVILRLTVGREVHQGAKKRRRKKKERIKKWAKHLWIF